MWTLSSSQTSVTVCRHVNIGKDSFLKFFSFLLFFILGIDRFLHVYKLSDTTRNSRNVACNMR